MNSKLCGAGGDSPWGSSGNNGWPLTELLTRDSLVINRAVARPSRLCKSRARMELLETAEQRRPMGPSPPFHHTVLRQVEGEAGRKEWGGGRKTWHKQYLKMIGTKMRD